MLVSKGEVPRKLKERVWKPTETALTAKDKVPCRWKEHTWKLTYYRVLESGASVLVAKIRRCTRCRSFRVTTL